MVAIAYEPMRWWHIRPALTIEVELFGDEAWSAAMFWSELAQHETRTYEVALLDQVLKGYAGLCVYGNAPGQVPLGEAWVQTIAVTAAAQGQGIGAALLTRMISRARPMAATLNLEVRVDNEAAQRLYARHGFEPVAIRRGYYQPSNTDALTMTLDLTQND